jgi:hypothetical protein
MTRCSQTDAERPDTDRPNADIKLHTQSRGTPGRHATRHWQTDFERSDAYLRDADS